MKHRCAFESPTGCQSGLWHRQFEEMIWGPSMQQASMGHEKWVATTFRFVSHVSVIGPTIAVVGS